MFVFVCGGACVFWRYWCVCVFVRFCVCVWASVCLFGVLSLSLSVCVCVVCVSVFLWGCGCVWVAVAADLAAGAAICVFPIEGSKAC